MRTQSSSGRGTESVEDESSLESNSQDGSVVVTRTLRDEKVEAIKNRARRTRIAFLLFGMGAIASIVLLIVFSFARMKESMQVGDNALFMTQEVINQLQSSLRIVESAGDYATNVVASTDFNLSELCPNMSGFESSLGVDLKKFATQALEDFNTLQTIMTQNLTAINDTVNQVQTLKNQIEVNLEYTQQYSWIAPGIFLGIALVTTVGMFGVLVAWRERSGRAVQRSMSYMTLPLLIFLSFMCWIFTMAAAAGAMSGGDACVAGGNLGGPDATISTILEQLPLDRNGTTFRMISTYTNGCRIHDPVQDLIDLEVNLQNSVNLIWQEISNIDSQNVTALCGTSLDNFLDGTRQLAKSLSTIRKAIASTVEALSCDVINPIYLSAVHDAICDDAVTGLSFGFILLLTLSICLMVLISLRAAWLSQDDGRNDEDKVYDEHEAAENMVLDEHEEYLAYISKYKHEWEDYEGINAAMESNMATNAVDGVDENRDDVHQQTSHDEDNYTTDDGEYIGESESSVAESTLPDDISFQSLQITPSVAEAAANIMVVPYLLPRSDSGDGEGQEAFEIISPRAAGASPRASIPPTIHTGQYMKKKDADSDCEAATGRDIILERRRQREYDERPKTSPSKLELNSDDEVEVCLCDSDEGSPAHRIYQRRPVSIDDDSIVDRIMMSFDAPQSSGEDDDEFLGHMYGVKLRKKESIEAELELRYGGYSRSCDEDEEHGSSARLRYDPECRDPPPSASRAPPKSDAVTTTRPAPVGVADEDEDIHKFRAEFPKSPSHSVSGRMQEMMTRFHHCR